jgi:hypothetical protein
MRRERRLFDMVPGASLEGTVLVAAPLDRAEVKKRVKSALGITIMDTELGIHRSLRFRSFLRFLPYASLCDIRAGEALYGACAGSPTPGPGDSIAESGPS